MTASSGSSSNQSASSATRPGREAPYESFFNRGASLSNELYLGTLRWDLLVPFPTQDRVDRRAGDTYVAEFQRFLRENVDPTAVDASRVLPAEVIEALRGMGCLRLMVDRADGGHGLSPFNTFRLVEAAASWSLPVANMMGIGNGFASGSYLRLLPDGPLRELLRAHVADGNFSARVDTEPAGAGNSRQGTTAVPVDGGAAYVLNGEKVFIGNGAVADLLDVTATVVVDGVEQSASFFVDARAPGVEMVERQDFMGFNGSPIGCFRLTDVRVPSSRMLSGPDLVRLAREVKEYIYMGRTMSVVPPSMAIARLCLHWSREFVNRRRIDGRPLGSYREIQRLVALSVADVFAMETFSHWAMLGRGADLLHEHAALKNVASVTCWRVVDRTVGLLGGEGWETARSKAHRGAQPLPVERFFRDARGLLVTGGVDFTVDIWAAQIRFTDCYYDRRYSATPAAEPADGPESARLALGRYDAEQVEFVTAEAARFGQTCRGLAERHPDRAELFRRQHTMRTLNRMANELLTMAVVLARAAEADAGGPDDRRALADICCKAARRRLTGLWEELDEGCEEDYAGVTGDWLGGRRYGELLGDAIQTIPEPSDPMRPV